MDHINTVPQGFTAADPQLFRCDNVVDLQNPNWFFCEFRFRGFLTEIKKLQAYLESKGMKDHILRPVSESIFEIRVFADEKTPELIQKFPALKATGLAEHWQKQEVYTMFSDSGFSAITKIQFGDYFDRRYECGDGRWAWEYDMMEPVDVSFVWLQTGEDTSVYYRYPFHQDWDWENYTLEIDGKIYVPETAYDHDFEIVDGVLKGYHGPGGNVVIPDSVHEICEYSQVFSNQATIRSVYIPGSIQTIPSSAFFGCGNLQKVVLGQGVKLVDERAFMCCTNLTELVLPETLVALMPGAFLSCENLDVAQLQLPAGIQCAGQAFRFCKNVPPILMNADQTILLSVSRGNTPYELVVPETVTVIGDYALWADTNLTGLKLPQGLRKIGKCAFRDCCQLKLENLPDSLEVIEDCAFSGCGKTETLILPDSVTSVGSQAFGFPVRKVQLSGSMKSVPTALFSKSATCGTTLYLNHSPDLQIALSEITLHEGTEQLEPYAFMGCAKLKQVQLPESLKRIGEKAFAYCNTLPEITLGNNVAEIREGAFLKCASLQTISLSKSLQILEKEAFRDCTSLKELTIPGTVTEISAGLAQKCTALQSVRLEPGVQKIAGRAFKDCAKLENVEIPSSVTKIAAKVFEGCSNVVIICEKGSAAAKYALKNNLRMIER